ncbi:hypothetical protein AGMMS49975_26160 [Clostridia bacterium]|nr:hypothetical protein AGMMS49975_26160 [Clostridia bacterium]
MGLFKLTDPNSVHREHHTPQGYAAVEDVVNTGYGQIRAYFDEAIGTIVDPPGDRANYMYRHWLEEAGYVPAKEKTGTTRRSSTVINYGAEHVGKKGYITVCFQGTDGSQGPWSEVRGFTLS